MTTVQGDKSQIILEKDKLGKQFNELLQEEKRLKEEELEIRKCDNDIEKEKRRELIYTRDVWIPHCSLMLYESLMKGLKHRDEKNLTTIFSEMIEEWNVPFQKILLYSPLFSQWKDEYLLKLVKCSQTLLHEIRRQMRTRNFEHFLLEGKIFEWGTLLNKNHEFINAN